MRKNSYLKKQLEIELLNECIESWRYFAFRQEKLLRRSLDFVSNVRSFLSELGLSLESDLERDIERVLAGDFIPLRRRKTK